MIVWALFDSGNSCYKQAVETYFSEYFEIYAIGMDKEDRKGNKKNFISLNLADYSPLFGENFLFEKLDQLPKADIILASPPCESWSVASSLAGGNLCWQVESINTLFGTYITHNQFALRDFQSFNERYSEDGDALIKPHWWRTIYNRINGELCAYNLIRIIEQYKPSIWVIENPQSSRIWNYYKSIHSFNGIKNLAHYHAYDDNFPKKPTIFFSNILLPLKTKKESANVVISTKRTKGRRVIRNYNERSNIPLLLIKELLEICLERLGEDGKKQEKQKTSETSDEF